MVLGSVPAGQMLCGKQWGVVCLSLSLSLSPSPSLSQGIPLVGYFCGIFNARLHGQG